MSHYDTLGVAPAATAAEIRQAYLRLVRERHPDRFPDPKQKAEAQEFFKHLTEAYNTLSNDRARQAYDGELKAPKLTAPAEIAADAHKRGLQKLQERDFHEAVGLLRSAVHNDPGVARYHADLGRALSNNPHWIREAVEELEQAVRIQGNNPGFYVELARILAGQGLKLRARRAAEGALRLAPDNAAAQQLVAELGGTESEGDPEPPRSGGLFDRLRRKS
jgi:curved DNA-binding protein CbpA